MLMVGIKVGFVGFVGVRQAMIENCHGNIWATSSSELY